MKLKKILAIHCESRAQSALSGNLGDAYLLKENPIYRRVRALALQNGYRFQATRFHDYDAFALTQLPRILKTKRIPYCDNVRCLKEVEAAAPGVFLWSELPPLRANYLLHESAHGVARSLRLKFKIKRKLSKDRELVLQVLLEEAFANACESMANVFCESALDDEFLFKNSYIMEKAPARKALTECIELIGYEETFKLSFLSFLFSNFLKTNDAFDLFDRVLLIVLDHDQTRIKSLKKKQIAIVKQAFRVGLELDPQFTIFTNGFCLRLMGIKKDLFDLLAFDFLKPFEKGGHYEALLNHFCMSVCANSLSK